MKVARCRGFTSGVYRIVAPVPLRLPPPKRGVMNWFKNLSSGKAKALLSLVVAGLGVLVAWKPETGPAVVVLAGVLKSPLSDHAGE